MNYILNTIADQVLSHVPDKNGEALFRIDGFEDAEIYEQIANTITDRFTKIHPNLTLNIKLARKKWKALNNGENTSSILSLESHGWVSDKESITYYRNLHSSNVLILMGTEDEDDSDGLYNVYTISPASLCNDLDKKYSRVFEDLQKFSDYDRSVVDRLYKDLFDYVAEDIVKLSNQAYKWQGTYSSISEFIMLFYGDLPQWGLPVRKNHLPVSSEILKKGNNLRAEHGFISRADFSKLSKSKYVRYQNQIEKYNGEYYDELESGSLLPFTNYKDFEQSLLDYIRGKDVKENQQKWLNFDFDVISQVLGTKLDSAHKEGKHVIKLSGSPLKAMTTALLYALTYAKRQNLDSVTKIEFQFLEAEIIPSEEYDGNGKKTTSLDVVWKNICQNANGVFELLNRYDWGLDDGVSLTIAQNPKSYFAVDQCTTRTVSDVRPASSNKTYHRIEFVIHFYTGNEDNYQPIDAEEKGKDALAKFEWSFSMNAPWLYSFRDVLSEDLNIDSKQSMVPIGIMKNIKELLFSKSEEEFFDNYSENTADYIDVIDAIGIAPDSGDKKLLDQFSVLGADFIGFVRELRDNGFYTTMNNSSSGFRIIDDYNKLGEMLLKTAIPQNSQWILDAFVHAFNLEESTEALRGNTSFEYCIVPAWHPASLQKIRQQKVFFLDGCQEWWKAIRNESKVPNNSAIDKEIDQLIELCRIQNVVSVFPENNDEYFGETRTYGTFAIYAANNVKNDNKLRDYIHKDAVFDDDFKKSDLTAPTNDSRMLLDVLKDYVRAFPDSYQHLRVTFINSTDLQPIVSSIYQFVQLYKDRAQNMRLEIQIIVSPENMGGKNYLQFWMDEFFSQDENVTVKTYLTEAKENEIDKKIDGNNDIIFFINFLKLNKLGFLKNKRKYSASPNECLFPIVYRPTPISSTSSSIRTIELTQNQFSAEDTHTQVVYYRNHMEDLPSERFIADREIYTDNSALRTVRELHNKAYWVACIDSGMDGAILRLDKEKKSEYPVIGFSTGKGSYGQYNVTITTRNDMLETLKAQLKARLNMLFHWGKEDLEKASDRCINQAGMLDGISLFSAINQKDYNINEFMAYVLTAFREEVRGGKAALKTVIHLDSYQHWFDQAEIANGQKTDSNSRPDFLILKVEDTPDDRIIIHATVVECKIAPVSMAAAHKEKAVYQAKHGIDVLSNLFDPNSQSVKRRYWYAQLYRALTFAQVTFANTTQQYKILAGKLSSILDGNFTIDWNGEVLGYWIDLDWENETEEPRQVDDETIKIFNIPQKCIQQLLLNGDEKVQYVSLSQDQLEDDEQKEQESKNQEREIRESVKTAFNPEQSEGQETLPSSDEEEETDSQNITGRDDQSNNGSTDGSDLKKSTPLKYPTSGEDDPAPKGYAAEDDFRTKNTLTDARILIGKSRTGKDVYWEYGHKNLANRHLLITGTSGQGKTYAIQCLLYELSKINVSAVIYDYTEGFRIDQMESQFRDKIGDKIHQRIVYSEGVPINPFKQHMIDVAGVKMKEKPADVGARIATIFKHVYGLGDQQFSAIYSATVNGLQKYKDQMNWKKFREELEAIGNSNAKTALAKMEPFFDSVTFSTEKDFDWKKILYSEEPIIYIFQLTNIARPIQVIITEMMLWDMWYFAAREGSKDKPFAVVLDEAQNLSHKENSPSAKILTEGRKFGWSAWYATQSLNVLEDDEVTRLSQASLKMYFKPVAAEIKKIAKLLDSTDPSNYVDTVQHLKKGQCIVQGEQRMMNGELGLTQAIMTSVTSLDERN